MPDLPNLSSVGAVLGLLAGFCSLIFFHEMGHFLAAKAVGIRVTQFALGIGPAIFSWRKGIGIRAGSTEPEYERRVREGADPATLGETEYRVNWIVPLGGYVKMLGQEDLKPESVSNDDRSFNRKPIWARAVVLSAGVVMNVILAMVYFGIAFMAGVDFPPAIIGDVAPNAPAAQVYAIGHESDENYRGLRPGDRVTHVDNDRVVDFAGVAIRVALSSPNTQRRLTIEREGEAEPLFFDITPEPPNERSPIQVYTIGIAPSASLRLSPLGTLKPELVAAGVEPGMEVVAVDDQPVVRFDQLEKRLEAAQGRPVPVTFINHDTGKRIVTTLSAVPLLDMDEDGAGHLLGFQPAARVLRVRERSPAQAAGLRDGDILARIGPRAWPALHEITEIVGAYTGRALPIEVLRGGELVRHDVTPGADGRLGIEMERVLDMPIVAGALPDSPAAALLLPPGSRITAFNHQPIVDWSDMQRAFAAEAERGDEAQWVVAYEMNLKDRPTGEAELIVPPQEAQLLAAAGWRMPMSLPFEMKLVRIAGDTPLAAAGLGIRKTHEIMIQTYMTLRGLAMQTISPRELRGVVGIAHEGTRIAQQGWTYLLFFLGLLSVNLAVLNFLPIPILDGGHIVFLIVEKIKGSPVSIRTQELATYLGLLLLAGLLLMTLYFDSMRLIFGG